MSQGKIAVHSEKAPAPVGPYNQAVWGGNTLYLSGQIPLTKEGDLVDNSVEEATEKVMENIGYILEEAGLGYEHLIKCTILLQNIEDFPRVNEVYGKYFENIVHAREAYQVGALPKGSPIEITAIAYKE